MAIITIMMITIIIEINMTLIIIMIIIIKTIIITISWTHPRDKQRCCQRLKWTRYQGTPFISEEIWHLIDSRSDDIIIAEWPSAGGVNEEILDNFEKSIEIVTKIRALRKEQNISMKEQLEVFFIKHKKDFKISNSIICKLANISKIESTKKKVDNAFSFLILSDEFFIPIKKSIDFRKEIQKLRKELDYQEGFLNIINNKLSNNKFLENAPIELVKKEKKKKYDVSEKISIIKKQLKTLSNNN